MPPARQIDSEGAEFIDAVSNHLYGNQDSPFVSVSASIIWAVKKAMETEHSHREYPSDSYITFLDPVRVAHYTSTFHTAIQIRRLAALD